MTAPLTPAQATRAGSAHAVQRDAAGRTPEEVARLFVTEANVLLSTAQALSSAQGLTALGAAQTLMGGVSAALAAAGAPTSGNPAGDPGLLRAAGLLTQLSSLAGDVMGALDSGMSLPLALASAATSFLPEGLPRQLASSVLQALAYAEDSDTPALTAAQGILGSLVSFAGAYAEQEIGKLPPGSPQEAAARAALGLGLPFLSAVAGGLSGSPERYVPGAQFQLSRDLRFASLTLQVNL